MEEANALMSGIARLNASIQRATIGGVSSTEAETEQARMLAGEVKVAGLRASARQRPPRHAFMFDRPVAIRVDGDPMPAPGEFAREADDRGFGSAERTKLEVAAVSVHVYLVRNSRLRLFSSPFFSRQFFSEFLSLFYYNKMIQGSHG